MEFIFRNQKCWYEINTEDKAAKIVQFTFSPTADTNFVDSDGDEYFYHCIYDRTDSPRNGLWFERNYEDCVVDDRLSYFNDAITNEEHDYIKAFIDSLLAEPESVMELTPKYILKLSYSWSDEVVDIPCNTWGEAVQKAQSSAFEAMSTVFCHAYGNEINVSIDENDNITIYYPRRNQYDYFTILEV